jgi:hypothetical protein
MKTTAQKLQELADATASKPAAAAIRAHNSMAKAIASLNNPRTSTAKADEQAREAARLLMSPGPRLPVPTRAQIESVTQKNASDHESVVGAMRVARLQRAGKM